MNERREFCKLLAAAPAAGILAPMLSTSGATSRAAEIACAADLLGRIPENIIYTKERPGVWKGKDGSHVPTVTARRTGDVVTLTVENKHGMAESHYIVRQVVISETGEVLAAKTFSWKDKPLATFEIKASALGPTRHVFVTSYCSLHDLWLAHVKLEA